MSKNFKPKDVDLRNGLCRSAFNKSEYEIIAKNIVIISIRFGNEWKPFSEEDYKEQCDHKVTDSKLGWLRTMDKKGFIDFDGKRYSVNLKFLATLSEFLKK